MLSENNLIIKSVSELQNIIDKFQDSKLLLLLDIDDTIIRSTKDFSKEIDKLKILNKKSKVKEEKDFYENLISAWRLEREVILTDPDWPEFIKNSSKSTFALTNMDVGKFGLINSMEEWRYKELQSLDINFNNQSPIDGIYYNQPMNLNICDATFFKGIFFTGKASKGSIVEKLLRHQKYDLTIFVDDRIEQLQDVAESCSNCGIESIMIQFQMQDINIERPLTDLENKILEIINENN